MTSGPYEVNDREFESVVRLAAPKRYEHFLKRICDTDETGKERSQFPLWPHRHYAEGRDRSACPGRRGAAGPGRGGLDAAVFPTPEGSAPVVPPQRLRDDILAYHDESYGG